MKELNVICTDKESGESFTQHVTISDEIAQKLIEEVDAYEGGEIKADSIMYELLRGCHHLSKLMGWEKDPDFEIIPEEWMLKNEIKNTNNYYS